MKSYWFCLRSNCISSSLLVKKMHECFLWVYLWCEKRLFGGWPLSLSVWLNKFITKSLKGFGTGAEVCFRLHWIARTNTAYSSLQRKDDWTVTRVVSCCLWRTVHTKCYCPPSRRMHKQLTNMATTSYTHGLLSPCHCGSLLSNCRWRGKAPQLWARIGTQREGTPCHFEHSWISQRI